MTTTTPVHIDGSRGEGGGQVLRTSLALSIVTGRALFIDRIRAGRAKPGLKHQHLAAVRAAAALCGARVDGAKLGSTSLRFHPGAVVGGAHDVRIGTAGSATLVAHTLLPALLHAQVDAELAIEGGTHVPLAPVFEHFARAYLPRLESIFSGGGASVTTTLSRHGFMPDGGGRVGVAVRAAREEGARRAPFALLERGGVRAVRLVAVAGRGLPHHVIERGFSTVRAAFPRAELIEIEAAPAGCALSLVIECDQSVDVFSALGSRGAPVEKIVLGIVDEARAFIAADVPVGEHLADQLLLPLALSGGGRFMTTSPTLHTRTNADVIRAFVDVAISFDARGERCVIDVAT